MLVIKLVCDIIQTNAPVIFLEFLKANYHEYNHISGPQLLSSGIYCVHIGTPSRTDVSLISFGWNVRNNFLYEFIWCKHISFGDHDYNKIHAYYPSRAPDHNENSISDFMLVNKQARKICLLYAMDLTGLFIVTLDFDTRHGRSIYCTPWNDLVEKGRPCTWGARPN